MNGPVTKMPVIYITGEDLCIELVCSTYSIEMYHCLHPTISVHIPIWCIVEYTVLRNVVAKILRVFFCLVNYHRWHEALDIRSGEGERCAPEGCSLSGLGPPYPVYSEEFISTHHFYPLYIGIKAYLATIPNLGWLRLDVFEVFWYCCYSCWIYRNYWLEWNIYIGCCR